MHACVEQPVDSLLFGEDGSVACRTNKKTETEPESFAVADSLAAPAELIENPEKEIPEPVIVSQEAFATPSPAEEKPPGNDRPNKTVTLLTVLGILLVGCVALLLIPGLSAGVMLLFYLCPFVAVGLYFLAKRIRQKTAHAIASGAKDVTVSAHHHRFRLMLDLFFLFALIGGVFLFLGNYTNVIASGIIGAFGSVLTGASILLTCSIAVILLVLLMFYLFRWRKDPTGYAPKRERHPRKDR